MFGKKKREIAITEENAAIAFEEEDVTPEEPTEKDIALEAKKKEKEREMGLRFIVETRNYYQKAYYHAIRVCFVMGIINILLFLGNAYQYKERPEPKYFASTPDLRLAPMTPLNEPVMSQGALLNWASNTVADTLAIDFRNYKKQLTDVRERYTPKAFRQLMSSMKASGNLKMIVTKHLSATAITTQAPIITRSGILKGTYTWLIEFPMVLSYEDSNGVTNKQDLLIKMRVVRCKTSVYPEGIQVAQLVTTVI